METTHIIFSAIVSAFIAGPIGYFIGKKVNSRNYTTKLKLLEEGEGEWFIEKVLERELANMWNTDNYESSTDLSSGSIFEESHSLESHSEDEYLSPDVDEFLPLEEEEEEEEFTAEEDESTVGEDSPSEGSSSEDEEY